jgi:hypothetical protein
MTTPATGKLILNIGKISDTRFKFSFATDEGTLFCEISVPMKGRRYGAQRAKTEGGRCQI